jgi:hypothetical protein
VPQGGAGHQQYVQIPEFRRDDGHDFGVAEAHQFQLHLIQEGKRGIPEVLAVNDEGVCAHIHLGDYQQAAISLGTQRRRGHQQDAQGNGPRIQNAFHDFIPLGFLKPLEFPSASAPRSFLSFPLKILSLARYKSRI